MSLAHPCLHVFHLWMRACLFLSTGFGCAIDFVCSLSASCRELNTPNTFPVLVLLFRENNVCDINAVHGLFATGTIEVSACSIETRSISLQVQFFLRMSFSFCVYLVCEYSTLATVLKWR